MNEHLTEENATESCYSKTVMKEIAERTGMSEGRVRNMISEIYDILHIKSGSEIGGLVW